MKSFFSFSYNNGKAVLYIAGIKFTLRLGEYLKYKNISCIRELNSLGYKTKYDITVNDYQKLVKNLDDKSAEIVSRAFVNLERVHSAKNKFLKLLSQNTYTDEEIKNLKKANDEFYSRIYKINEDCYAYGKYLLPINNFEISVFYDKHGLDELKTIDAVKNKAIIDVGGFIGDSAILFSEVTSDKVYTFEPVAANLELMKKTIELNNAKNIVPVKLGLGKCKNKTTISVNDAASSIKSDRMADAQQEEIEITTLDSYVEENNLEVGMIKVDIEGAEQDFLAGAKETICKQKPVLLLSIYHSIDDYLKIKPLIESWDLGYSFKIYHPSNNCICGETLLICEVV